MPTIKQKSNNVKTEEPTKNGGELVRDEQGRFIEGHPILEGSGRPKGVRDFATDFEEAISELAEKKGITFSEARKELLKVAYVRAKKGNFPFYKDTMDRYYGDPEKEIERPPQVQIIKEQKNIFLVVKKAEEDIKKELEK